MQPRSQAPRLGHVTGLPSAGHLAPDPVMRKVPLNIADGIVIRALIAAHLQLRHFAYVAPPAGGWLSARSSVAIRRSSTRRILPVAVVG